MRVHYLQHVHFEGLGSIKSVLKDKGYQLSATHLYDASVFPAVDEIDWLIVMGGPMGVYDDDAYPWLTEEKRFIKSAIDSGKVVLGICLGAQLIAAVLGAKVYRNKRREIGWFNIDPLPAVKETVLANVFPPQAEVFHWHGDTFEIPEGAVPLAVSEACQHQGFILENRVIGFQFHLETTLDSATALIENCRDELDDGPYACDKKYVQSEKEMLADAERFYRINRVMLSVLNVL